MVVELIMGNDLKKIKDFEIQLDQALELLPSLAFDGDESIRLAMNFIDYCYMQLNHSAADRLEDGLRILAPYFIQGKRGPEPTVEQLFPDLLFAGHYFILREYLYYTYNATESFVWQFTADEITIKFNDPTIPRQFYIQANNHLIGSMNTFEGRDYGERIMTLLRGRDDEFTYSEEGGDIGKLLEEEADLKLSVYYNFLDPTDEIDMGGYTYREYYLIFKALMMKALYHRYHSKANETPGIIMISPANLINDLHMATQVPPEICSKVLDDITYSDLARRERIQPVYFSLYRLGNSDQIAISPFDLSFWEGLINIFRVVAIRRPQVFLENISARLGDNFVNYVEALFVKQGFRCLKNLQLSRFDSRLPDIDLLVISEEKTFGYVLFCCEAKNPIPPQWAKDHLRVLNEDSIAKAFGQLDLINEFLISDAGINFLRRLLPPGGLPHFGGEFLVSIFNLVITSRNAGMFFGDRSHAVIDYITLERLLDRCDGDVVYLMRAFRELGDWVDGCLKIVQVDFEVGTTKVTYEGADVGKLLDFRQAEYKSANIDKQLAEDFIRDGRRPHDTLEYIRQKLEDENPGG